MPGDTPRRIVPVAAALAIITACSGPASPPAFTPLPHPPRNLIVIVIDTLRRDHLGAYGYRRSTSPELDRLAAAGVRADGLAPSSWTKSSTASLLTGLHPIHHQAFSRDDALPQDATTLPEILKTRGFRTFGFSTNRWISKPLGFDQGFDTLLLGRDLGYSETNTTPAEANREILDRFLPATTPFFLYVHYIDPHLPYDPAIDWTGAPLSGALKRRAPMTQDLLAPLNFQTRPPELIQTAIDLYDGEIRVADTGVRELLSALEARGMMTDTMVIVTSDHGEEFSEHGRMGHGHTLYRELTDVPLIFYAPASFEGGRRIGTVSLIDVVPTVLDLMDVPLTVPAIGAFDGISVAEAVARGAPVPARDRLLHLDFDDGHSLAYVRGTEKLLLSRYPFRKELFDTAADPAEQANLFAVRPAMVRDLSGRLSSRHNDLWAETLRRSAGRAPPEILDGLRALGYIGAADGAEQRRIPASVGVPDDEPDGRLGWEDTARACVTTIDLATDSQLLGGWHRLSGEKDGRWTEPRASLLLGPPATTGSAEFTLTGINHRPGPFRLQVSIAGSPMYDGQITPGPFTIRAPAGRVAEPVLVRLEAGPAFRPADHGSADHRVLGTYVTRVCLVRTQ